MTDHLVQPHGGVLVDLVVDADRAAELTSQSRDWPSWDLTPRQVCDLELLMNETGNVTLAVMTPHTHDYEFAPLPPGTIALRVADVAAAKAKLEEAGVEVNEMWDSGACRGASVSDPSGNRILLHRRYASYE